MRFAEQFRRSVFWINDRFRGGRITSHYRELASLLNNPNRKLLDLHQSIALKSLLDHSIYTTRFYSVHKYFGSINDFPVINKSIIKENFTDFLSVKYDVADLHKVTTSGSTGAPLTVYQDKVKRARHQADNIYFSEIGGYKIGTRLYYLRVWNDMNRKSPVQRFMQNIVMVDAGDLSDDSLKSFIERIKRDNSTKSLLAFSSTYEALSHYLTKNMYPGRLNISSIITMSEALPDGAKQRLREVFNCPVVSRYSNMENGFLAQQCIGENNEYHLNEASYYFELLHPDKDEPVETGKLGRIVVTDLFNYAMPLIRYDTGDMAVLEERSLCGRPGRVFSRVEGRKVDFIYDTKGNLLSPHVITNTMWKYSSEVRQFQFIQNGKDIYMIKLNCPASSFTRGEELTAEFRNYLGKNAIIQMEFVDEIALLASGKRKKIVCNYKPEIPL
ncbi:MAG TPA: hypothetical protein PLX41_10555 [Bacteroidales bacterium]|nr:hypothetical protein [Bacteroidales bacterium]